MRLIVYNRAEVNMDKFIIIDGNSLINRAFYALPPLANFEGEISNGVFGFINILTKAIIEIKPKYIAVAFDFAHKTFRNDLYAEYKEGRKPMPEQLRPQFPMLKELLGAMNVVYIEQKGIEADDIIGSLSTKFKNVQNIILTGDKDCLQLINDNTTVMFTRKGISEVVMYDEKQLKTDFNLEPSQIVDLKALMGDSSDNIPGVPSVGEKTAKNLLEKYFDVDGVYKNIDEINGKLQEKLIENKDLAYLCKKLATIKIDFDLKYELKDFVYDFPYNQKTKEIFKKYQFNSLLKRREIFKESNDLKENSTDSKVIQKTVEDVKDVQKIIDKIKEKKIFAIYLDKQMSLCCDGTEYNFKFDGDLLNSGLDFDEVIAQMKPVFESKSIKKVCFDSKDLMHKLYSHNIVLKGVDFDVVLARYLVNINGKSNLTIKDLIYENALSENCCAYNLLLLKDKFQKVMKDTGVIELYNNIEMPLVAVLFDMEISGFKIDQKELNGLEQKYEEELEILTEQIYEDAGKKFNINSPKQLSEILFDDLKLDSYNNKKRSTGVDHLNDMINLHPIISKILRYRQIYKLYATYIKSFKKLINTKTSKIYTLFNQALTSTGRLSSSEPNLQNIPVRSDEGRALRRIFVPTSRDGFIVSADYNQIELRLLAHLSGDKKLIDLYNHNEDVHTRTASEIFGVDTSMVTTAMRRDAKAINFGIIYGISDYGLSQNIGSSRQSAGEYIKTYFERYPSVKTFMDKNVAFARENGYIKTMFSRVRYIPEISNSNYNIRGFGERVAMNMPLQGSASDIIKLAMIKVAGDLEKNNLKSKLILQIHDELIIDCEGSELKKVKEILKNDMELVADLKVPLPINLSVGKNLYEAK